jgi:hypothetical protein
MYNNFCGALGHLPRAGGSRLDGEFPGLEMRNVLLLHFVPEHQEYLWNNVRHFQVRKHSLVCFYCNVLGNIKGHNI